MEIIDFLQLVLLLALLAAVAILLFCLRTKQRLQDRLDKDDVSKKNHERFTRARAVPRSRNVLNRQPARRLAGG